MYLPLPSQLTPDQGRMRPSITCMDGFNMSVQASAWHYCTPRQSGLSEYEEVEVGFPSEDEELIQKYLEWPESDVYGYVPVEVIWQVIIKHGGLKH